MTIAITCSSCSVTSKIPTSLFAERFAGRKTTIRCKRCQESIVVDDTAPDASLLDRLVKSPGSDGSLGALTMEAASVSESVSASATPPEAALPPPAPEAEPAPRARRSKGRIVAGLALTLGISLSALLVRAPRGPLVERAPVSQAAVLPTPEPSPRAELPAPPALVAAPVDSASIAAAPSAHDERALGFALRWGVQQAEICHRQGGRPAELLHVELVFESSGLVSHVALGGDNAPGSAEERCILSQLRALKIPPFAGQSLRISREIKLR